MNALLAEVVASRRLCLGLTGAALAHVALVRAGLIGWPCPVLAATGFPCPGCGLGRACALLLGGELAAALEVHALAPAVVVFIALCLVGGLRRGRQARRWPGACAAWSSGCRWGRWASGSR